MRTATLLSIPGVAIIAPLLSLAETPPPKGIEIYTTALIETSKEMERQWGYLKENPLSNETPTDYKHLLVCSDESVPGDYPSRVEGRQFDYLTRGELFSRRKTAKKDLSVLIINLARIEGSRVKVVIEQRSVGVYDGKPALAVSDWGAVFFRFDCERREFIFDEVKLGGI